MENQPNTTGYRVLLSEVTWRTVDVLASSEDEAEQLALDNPEWGKQGEYPTFLAERCEECHEADFAPGNAESR